MTETPENPTSEELDGEGPNESGPGHNPEPAEGQGAAAADTSKGSNVQKDPDQWVTGEEPMTGAQASYLKTLSEQAGESFDTSLSKADASKRIDELQQRTGRGRG